MRRFAIACAAVAVLAGCAPLLISAGTMAGVMGQAAVGSSLANNAETKQQRQLATAAAIGPKVEWYSVKVSGVRKRGNTVSWTANTPLGRYACSEEFGQTVAACVELS